MALRVAQPARRNSVAMVVLALSLGACTPASGPPVTASTVGPGANSGVVQSEAPAPPVVAPQQGTVVYPSTPGYAYYPPFRSDLYAPAGPAFGFGLGPRPGIGHPFGW
jgi:hypothetical protein